MPSSLARLATLTIDYVGLWKAGVAPCDASRLAPAESIDIEHIFRNQSLEEEWNKIQPALAALAITDQAYGVNMGDRRAIYYLVRGLRVTSVLEIGTHIGASTIHIAAALKSANDDGIGDASFVSVDICDVNDPSMRPWRRFGSSASPADMIRTLGCDRFVDFKTANSFDYFSRCDQRYDLIFLDGNHSPGVVYREIPAALRCVAKGGWILLHDYFPDLRPLWSDGTVLRGPYMAIKRLQREGAPLRVIPLGELPWPTKLGSNITNLALLGRD